MASSTYIPNEFEQLVSSAVPYAKLCFDMEKFASACSEVIKQNGEAAVFLKFTAPDPKRFPVALNVWGVESHTLQKLPLAQVDLERPDYTNNPDGFRGNHLINAILLCVRNELEKRATPFHLKVFTSESAWLSYCRDAAYTAQKEHRVLDQLVNTADQKLSSKPSEPKRRL